MKGDVIWVSYPHRQPNSRGAVPSDERWEYANISWGAVGSPSRCKHWTRYVRSQAITATQLQSECEKWKKW